jgi:hypothetical protein
MGKTDTKQQLPESPASVTARVVSPNGFHLLFTLRDETGTELIRKFEEFEKAVLAKGWVPETNAGSNFARSGIQSDNGYKMVGFKSGKASAGIANTTCAKCGAPAMRKTGKRKDDSTWEGVFCTTGDDSHKMWLS